jgi:hypothetical protein
MMSETETKPVVVVKNPEAVKAAIVKGKEVIAAGGTKADAARAMFEMMPGEVRETIVEAFIAGAGLTPKGAPTYFYNVVRQSKKNAKKRVPKKPE